MTLARMRRRLRRAGRLRQSRLALGAMVLAAGLVAAGCSSVRDDLGTSSSDCYIALATASAAVNGAGHLQGVRLVSVASLRSSGSRALYRSAVSVRPRASRVCLVAYAGTFRAQEVHHPLGRASGHLAVVAVTYPGKRVVGTLILERSTMPFSHTHIGLASESAGPPASASPLGRSTTTAHSPAWPVAR
jgi:hypothetical protein